jgi:hypothetical protein
MSLKLWDIRLLLKRLAPLRRPDLALFLLFGMDLTQPPSARLKLGLTETFGLVEEEYADRPVASSPKITSFSKFTLTHAAVSAPNSLYLSQ